MKKKVENAIFSLLIMMVIGCSIGFINYSVKLDQSPEPVALGAIRWDAWYKNPNPISSNWNISDVVEKTLLPEQFQYRVPYFAQVANNSITMPLASQKLIDEEIQFAKEGRIDYWAYCWYCNGTGMELARLLHQSSAHRTDVKMCAILENGHFNNESDISGLVYAFKTDYYQTVLKNRPLVFFFSVDNRTHATIDRLQERCIQENIPVPYIVLLSWNETEHDPIGSLGADAVSNYATFGENGMKYNTFMRNEKRKWQEWKQQKYQVIPIVTTGWDPRPRIVTPTIWVDYPNNSWVQPATSQEIADQVAMSLLWCWQNPNNAEAKAVLMYAWNEFDEGGWLLPTYEDILANKTIVPKRLQAIAQIRTAYDLNPIGVWMEFNAWKMYGLIIGICIGCVSIGIIGYKRFKASSVRK